MQVKFLGISISLYLCSMIKISPSPFLKNILHQFVESIGLRVNFDKYFMVPVNVPADKFHMLANTFGCSKGSQPFTYLGLPLSITNSSVADFWPIVSRCECWLISTASFLSEACCLEITNAVLTALPTFAMSTFLLPKTIIKQVDKFRKHCLWQGSDVNNRKPSRVAWPMVCVPKDEGGLGVLNLRTYNECLLLTHLHKFYNRQDIPWVQLVWHLYYTNDRLPKLSANFHGSFWWRDLLKLLDSFKGMATVSIKDVKSSYLWLDL